MKIAINTRLLLPGRLEGVGVFTFETMKRIVRQQTDHTFYFLFDRPFSAEFVVAPNVIPLVIPPPARHPMLWYLWFEVAIPLALRKVDADVFVSTDGYGSLRLRRPQLVVMHDLAFEHFPQFVGGLTARYYRFFSPRYARTAQRIVTVSQYSRRDIQTRYGIDPSKIDVVPCAPAEHFEPLDETERQHVRNRLTQGLPYFIYAGALQPRKNIIGLLQAFDVYKKRTGSSWKLVLAGRDWHYRAMHEVHRHMQYAHDVIFCGHLKRQELARTMAASSALVYVSYFEGFGIPLLEAMRCGVPVICSNTSSMPEVAGPAALLVRPDSIPEIAAAMERIQVDAALRDQLIALGFEQQKKFSWDIAADQLWTAIQKTVQSP